MVARESLTRLAGAGAAVRAVHRWQVLLRELMALAEELRRGLGSCLLDGRLPTHRRRLCQSFPVGITVAGSTISKTVRPCACGR